MQNLTQAELGNLIGKTQSQISMIETGQVDIATEELERIANILNYKGEPRRLLDAYASVAA